MLTKLKNLVGKLTPAQRVEALRDVSVFVGALVATGILDGGHLTRAAVGAALVTAIKVTARAVFPHAAE
jgi:hypothetical protein